MATQKPDMSCARVVQYKASGLDKIYRHNERRNESYGNENVITEMSRYNIHFKDPGDETYTEIFRRLEAEGVISTRGLILHYSRAGHVRLLCCHAYSSFLSWRGEAGYTTFLLNVCNPL